MRLIGENRRHMILCREMNKIRRIKSILVVYCKMFLIIVQVKLPNWNLRSKIYLIFTSYKLLANGEACRGETKH